MPNVDTHVHSGVTNEVTTRLKDAVTGWSRHQKKIHTKVPVCDSYQVCISAERRNVYDFIIFNMISQS